MGRPDARSRAWPLWLAGCLAVGVVVTSLSDFAAHLGVALLDANRGSSWSHRLTAAILAVSALVALLRAVRVRGGRAWWSAAAGVLVVLFIVEISPAHVEVDRLRYGKLVYLPLLACLVACLWRLTRRSGQWTLMSVGLAALAASYAVHLFGLDAVEGLGFHPGGWADQVKAGIKEAAELAGWLLVLVALARLASLDGGIGILGKLTRWAVGREAGRG